MLGNKSGQFSGTEQPLFINSVGHEFGRDIAEIFFVSAPLCLEPQMEESKAWGICEGSGVRGMVSGLGTWIL